MERIAVIGAGPSGMMAAWACMQAGHQVRIYEPGGREVVRRRLKEDTGISAGVFLLHHHCDLLPLRGTQRMVLYETIGAGHTDKEQLTAMYRHKVYGPEYQGEVSIEEYNGEFTEWDGTNASRLLFDIVHDVIDDGKLVGGFEPSSWLGAFNKVIVTAPLHASFPPAGGWRMDWAGSYQEVRVYTNTAPDDESYVWYAPHVSLPWYRAAGAFGRFTLEFPGSAIVGNTRQLIKPIAPPDDVKALIDKYEADGNVLFVGRYGRWTKGIEQHDVYRDVLRWLGA